MRNFVNGDKIMNKIFIIIAITVFSFPALAENQNAPVDAAEPGKTNKTDKPSSPSKPLVRDGCAFPNNGIEGLVTKSLKEKKWYFTPYTKITDGRAAIEPGRSIEMLPSNTLQEITALMDENPKESNTIEVRLWAKITRYSNNASSKIYFFNPGTYADKIYNRNFIFPTNFIPLTPADKTQVEQAAAPPSDPNSTSGGKSILPEKARRLLQENTEKSAAEIKPKKKKTSSIIPENIMEKFNSKRAEDFKKWKQTVSVEKDRPMVNRTGFIKQQNGRKVFSLDALGRSVNSASYILLPCERLQLTEKMIARSPGRNRYKVSGIVTKFKGKDYLLLQRAVKTYNNQNFAR